MRTFTRLIVIAVFVISHLAAYTVMADGRAREAGVLPTNTGGATGWKSMPEKRAETNAKADYVQVRSRATSYHAAAGQSLYLTQVAYASSAKYPVNSYLALMPMAERPTPSINAYPNPSRGITRVSLSQVGLTENYKLKISNTIGKVMETHELPVTHSNVFLLDMTGYPAGVYFYSLLVNDKTVETKRLILQK